MKHRLSQKTKTLWYLEKCWRQVMVFFKRNQNASLKLSSQLQEVKADQFGYSDYNILKWIQFVKELDFPEFSRNFQLILGNITATDEEMKRLEEAIGILQIYNERGFTDE